MTENKTVSVIVPIYNTQQYLDACIASIVKQTYADLEILLILDGATDNSAEICKKWQAQDPRITVFENENHGVSYSRNFGIERCSGQYVTFVDSDDLVHEAYVQSLVALRQASNAALVAVKAVAFDESCAPQFALSERTCVRREDLHATLFTVCNGFVWGKLFDARILKENNIRFDREIYICEDLLMNFRYVDHCTAMAFSDSALYGYRQRRDSAVHNTVSPRWFSCLRAYQILLEDYRETTAFTHIVFHGLKNLYEARYLLRRKKVTAESVPVDIEQEQHRLEQYKNLLTRKQRLRLLICKYAFFVVLLRRK